ncbi:hypothetical protein [Pseudonocardia yunnanensis]|uniref:Uncharacterized protein n=1 Tax=Pseudonocardia yunnanensis TaxID=58107 RepID=A0ABW4EYL5_9PSEU
MVAPTTLLTALLLYFGRLHAQALFRYLRVPWTVFELTPEDYLIRSADGLFVPVTIAAGVAVLACWAHYLLVGSGSDRARAAVVRAVAPLAAVGGIALVVFAAVATVAADAPFPEFPESGGLSLAIGVLLLAYAVRLIRTLAAGGQSRGPARPVGGAVAEWTAIFVLVGVGLFWAVNGYAIGVGTSRAEQLVAELGFAPDAVLYSEKRLGLELPGVREVPCQDPDAAYRFRYEGLKLVLQSGDQYLFFPGGWTREDGVALIIPRGDALRLEFTGPGRATPAMSC